jgi:hypothetical protein
MVEVDLNLMLVKGFGESMILDVPSSVKMTGLP